MRNEKTIADLKIGESGVISDLVDDQLSLKLLQMGCTPGCKVKLSCKAPLGGPVCICVCGYNLSMRLEEAASITLE